MKILYSLNLEKLNFHILIHNLQSTLKFVWLYEYITYG